MNSLSILGDSASFIENQLQPIRVLGIDLGTTNSTIAEAVLDPQKVSTFHLECIPIKQPTLLGDYSHLMVPSVVALYGGKVFIGEGAKRLRAGGRDFEPRQYENLFYECKNEIGTLRTYHRAPIGFQSASEIGGKVLEFLYYCAMSFNPNPARRVVVTVPASFQLPQREDTLKAARLAGLDVESGGLLDEPLAAFIDYVARSGSQFKDESGGKNWVVFDFGGGTCDVAVLSIEFRPGAERPRISPLSVSRYHRLGGGDIDAAIVYEVLIPELYRQNNISEFDFGWEVKKRILELVLYPKN